MVVLEKVEQVGGLDVTALERFAGLGVLKAVVPPVMEENSLEAPWVVGGREGVILLVQKKALEVKRGVWRGEALERENIWAFWCP